MWPQVQLTSWNFSKLAKCRNCSPISSLAHVLGGGYQDTGQPHEGSVWWCYYGAFLAPAGEGVRKDISIMVSTPVWTQIREVIPRIRPRVPFLMLRLYTVHCTDISSYHPSMPITIMWAAVPTSPCSSWFFDFNSLLLTCPDYLGSSVPLGRLATSKVPFTP